MTKYRNKFGIPPETIADINETGKALSDPNRVRALMALRNGELCVCQLVEFLHLAPSTVSKHMSILKQAGLVESRKDSRWVYYRAVETSKYNFRALLYEIITEAIHNDKTITKDDKTMKEIRKNEKNICGH